MRERYESLSAFVLKDLAKARGIKGVSAMKKSQIIERMLEEDAKMAEADAAKPKTKAETEEKNKPETKPKAGKKQSIMLKPKMKMMRNRLSMTQRKMMPQCQL